MAAAEEEKEEDNYLITTLTLVSPGPGGAADVSDIAAGASASTGS